MNQTASGRPANRGTRRSAPRTACRRPADFGPGGAIAHGKPDHRSSQRGQDLRPLGPRVCGVQMQVSRRRDFWPAGPQRGRQEHAGQNHDDRRQANSRRGHPVGPAPGLQAGLGPGGLPARTPPLAPLSHRTAGLGLFRRLVRRRSPHPPPPRRRVAGDGADATLGRRAGSAPIPKECNNGSPWPRPS